MPAFYFKKFEIRWSDVDANRHLGNTAYINFMSHVRMSYYTENGFGQLQMAENNIGPVITYENLHYFKEIPPDRPIWVSLTLKGLSESGSVFEFIHRFYDENGKNLATCEMMGTWIDLTTRRLTNPPTQLSRIVEELNHENNYEKLSITDLRSNEFKPIHLDEPII